MSKWFGVNINKNVRYPYDQLVIMALNLDAYHMLTETILWARASNKHCLNMFSSSYAIRAEAQAACLNLGAKCGGVEDLSCDGVNAFSLCTAGGLEPSRAGSCVYTPAGTM